MFAAQTGARRGTGPRPTVKAAIKHSEGNPLACACGMRGPSPYVKERRFFIVAGTCHRDIGRFRKHPQITLSGYRSERTSVAMDKGKSRPGGLAYRDASRPGGLAYPEDVETGRARLRVLREHGQLRTSVLTNGGTRNRKLIKSGCTANFP